MAVPPAINTAITALRSALGNDKKQKASLNKLRDAFSAVEAVGSPHEFLERTTRLVQLLSESIPALHSSHAQQTMNFCAAAIRWLFKSKLESVLEKRDIENAARWEDAIFRGLMQPILNIVDSGEQDAANEVLYPPICEVLRSPWSKSLGGRFAHSLALVLVLTCLSPKTKGMLLNSNIFGSAVLAKLIVDAKGAHTWVSFVKSLLIVPRGSDYHYLDTLIELSFTIFSSQGGKISRRAYADNIFNDNYTLGKLPESICNELASIHAVTNGSNSEKHILDLIRTMSRAGIERPQVFTTQDLSYCGRKCTQMSPSNVMVLDHTSLCVIICDQNKESDVLAVLFTAITGIELVAQDASRVLVGFVIAEPPLISSSREAVAAPDGHKAELPLRLTVTIATSDVFGFEAALAARNLAGVLKGHGVLTRNSSLASAKISNAVSSIALKKTNNEQAEELLRKYVNLPSSTGGSSPVSARIAEPISGVESHKAQATPQTLTIAVATKQPRPKRAAETQKEPRSRPTVSEHATGPIPSPLTRSANSPSSNTEENTAADRKLEIVTASEAPGRAEQPLLDAGSELTDIETIAPQGEFRAVVRSPPVVQDTTLPTPPRTRTRARQDQLVAKTLVPATPDNNRQPESTLSDISSPTPKPARKRKRIEDSPIELPVLNPGRPAKQKKIDDVQSTSALTDSQHIIPRNTAATRAKAKYGTNTKRRGRSSSRESIRSADTARVDPPVRKETPRLDDTLQPEVQHPLSVRCDNDPPRRRTRAAVANAKPKSGTNTTIVPKVRARNESGGSDKLVNDDDQTAPEKQKPQRGRPPKNKLKGDLAKSPERPNQNGAAGPPVAQLQGKLQTDLSSTRSLQTANPEITPILTPHEPTKETQGVVEEEDDLLKRLSQAAKKALKAPLVNHQLVQPCSPSLTRVAEVTNEGRYADEDVDVESVDPPNQAMEPYPFELVARQTLTMPVKNMEHTEVGPVLRLPEIRSATKGTKPANASTDSEMARRIPDVSTDDTLQAKAPFGSSVSTKQGRLKGTETGDNLLKDLPNNAMGVPSARATEKGASLDIQLNSKGIQEPTRLVAPEPLPGSPLTENFEPRRLEELTITRSPKTPIQPRSGNITKRIQSVQTLVDQTPTPRDASASQTNDWPHIKKREALVPVKLANSDNELDGTREPLPQRPRTQPVRRPSTLAVRPITQSTTQPWPKPLFVPASEVSKAKHAAVTRVLFTNQPSPKSALASPQKRAYGGSRPSVSFLEPPVESVLRRGSSDSSIGAKKKKHDNEREKLPEGKSAQTNDVVLRVKDTLDGILEVIASNMEEKVQVVTAEARSARAELTKAVVSELDSMGTESEHCHAVLHELETMFASQAQTILEGFYRVDRCNARITSQVESVLSSNARAGQHVAEAAINFELPRMFSGLLTHE